MKHESAKGRGLRGVPFSVLDLAPIVLGSDAATALRRSLDLARHAERWGYLRFWLAEHHGMRGIASAATAVVIGHVAGGTSTIRVGSGGIMLPNHAPLVIAEQFGTLESLHPGRIDLGVGRAPGTDPMTTAALRRDTSSSGDTFARDLMELMAYFRPIVAGQRVKAVPGAGLSIPVWVLGSSLFGASLAAALGLPFAFASHFAPAQLMPALETYRSEFRPSEQLARPHVMLGVNVIAAETRAEARLLFTSLQQVFLNMRLGRPGQLAPPSPDFESTLSDDDRAILDQVLSCSFVGTPEDVRAGLEDFLAQTQADELIVAAQIHDHAARLRSYELTAQVREAMGVTQAR